MNIVLRLLFLSLFPLSVLATPIQFTHTGVGSGVIGSITFQDAAFVITGTGDTDNLQFGGKVDRPRLRKYLDRRGGNRQLQFRDQDLGKR